LKFSLHPGAASDIRNGAKFYVKEGGHALVGLFFEEIERAIELIQAFPKLGVMRGEHLRVFVINRFPYSLVYRITAQGLRVLALAHHSRSPGYWKKRVR
jgi:toxin ParE1/3/4